MALVIVAGIVGMSACADCLGDACAHALARNADRSGGPGSLLRRVLCALAAPRVTRTSGSPFGHASMAAVTPPSVPLLLGSISLRI